MARVVVPRTIESSTTTRRLPAMLSRSGLSLRRTAVDAGLLVGVDEGPADVAVLHQSLAVGDAAAPGVALGGRDARVGHAHHQVGRRPGPARPGAPPSAAGPRAPPGRAARCRAGRSRRTRRCTAGVDDARGGEQLLERTPSASIMTISPGLELADEGGADDVEGRRLRGQHPALGSSAGPSRPRHSGRNPWGSRTP